MQKRQKTKKRQQIAKMTKNTKNAKTTFCEKKNDKKLQKFSTEQVNL